jgi:dienelactone hydrolase
MSQPLLAVFGAADPLVDARESDAILRGLHKRTLTSRMYADAEHNLYTVSEPQFRRSPRGFFPDLESWLLVGPRR